MDPSSEQHSESFKQGRSSQKIRPLSVSRGRCIRRPLTCVCLYNKSFTLQEKSSQDKHLLGKSFIKPLFTLTPENTLHSQPRCIFHGLSARQKVLFVPSIYYFVVVCTVYCTGDYVTDHFRDTAFLAQRGEHGLQRAGRRIQTYVSSRCHLVAATRTVPQS